ncbi:MAG: hypothetical protein ACK4TA_18770 [Saprospiraceae bacterium]
MYQKSTEITLSNNQFPVIEALDLAGKPVSLPNDCKGKPTLISIAFVTEAQYQIDTWAKPFMQQFVNDSTAHYYEIPMIDVKNRLYQNFIDWGMRSSLPKSMHSKVMTYYGDFEFYCKALKMNDINKAYIFLLNENGNIIYRNEGFAQPEQLKLLFTKIENLLLKSYNL